jgi:uncharacterized membrane protein YbaN (DUF454 family)
VNCIFSVYIMNRKNWKDTLIVYALDRFPKNLVKEKKFKKTFRRWNESVFNITDRPQLVMVMMMMMKYAVLHEIQQVTKCNRVVTIILLSLWKQMIKIFGLCNIRNKAN